MPVPKPETPLTIEPVYDATEKTKIVTYRLFGEVAGERVRKSNVELSILVKLKEEYEKKAQDARTFHVRRPMDTWLSADQLKSAEALWHEFRAYPKPIIDYARAGVGVLGSGARVLCSTAMKNWEDDMRIELKLEEVSISSNIGPLKAFLEFCRATHLDEIRAEHIENWCSLTKIKARDKKRGASPNSKIGRLSRVRAFLNFCVAKRLIAKSPFEVDVKKLRKQAGHHKERARICSPEQCAALLDAAIEFDPRYVPFVILSTWCFMRRAEVKRALPEFVKLDRAQPFIEPEPHKVGTASYRTTNIPENMVGLLRECIETGLWAEGKPPYHRNISFKILRDKAGLMKLGPLQSNGVRPVVESTWQPNILRHSGISYLFQHLSDKADRGEFKEASVIAAVTRQAGNSEDVAFKHYINIADASAAAKFYAIRRTLKKEIAQDSAQAVA